MRLLHALVANFAIMSEFVGERWHSRHTLWSIDVEHCVGEHLEPAAARRLTDETLRQANADGRRRIRGRLSTDRHRMTGLPGRHLVIVACEVQRYLHARCCS